MSRRHTPESFWARIEKTSGCWNFVGATNSWGYGCLGYQRRIWLAHRLAWTLTNGPLDAAAFLCHHCDNRLCVRPEHLYVGTAKTNAGDRDRRGRRAPPRGESNGFAKLTAGAVLEIRRLLELGHRQVDLAEQFGVGQSTISRVKREFSWKGYRNHQPIASGTPTTS